VAVKHASQKVRGVLGSQKFWYAILILFALQSLWVAFSARYPMAFDEDFHFGIIQVYSHHWLPFLSGQPAGSAQYGPLQHDPSYLYHYLMSFPYRLVTAFTDSQTIQVIFLRCINIVFMGAGLVLFRRLLVRAGSSLAFTQVALAMFVLIPILPVLAGQINYDNLLLPLTAGALLLAFQVRIALQERRVAVRAFLALATVCMLASLVKYAFLPIAFAIALFLLVAAVRTFGRHGGAWLAVRAGWRNIDRSWRIGLVLALVLCGGLFVQRYGVNVVQYHTPIPDCDVVLGESDCQAYGPWLRNHQLAQVKGTVDENPLAYTMQWLQSLHYRLFFAVNGPYDDFRNYPPLPLPSAAAIALGISGVIALALYGKRVFSGQPLMVLLAMVAVAYCLVLWGEDYSQYLETGEPVAINGRYLLPVILPLAAILGRAFGLALRAHHSLKPLLAGLAIVMFLEGGGLLTFIARSDDAWYWPNATVSHLNNGARRVLAPVVIEGAKYY
jgi:hypothetical protein